MAKLLYRHIRALIKWVTKDIKVCGIRLIIPVHDMLAGALSKTVEALTTDAIILERQIERREPKLINFCLRCKVIELIL